MALNKNALIRYRTIDKCLQNHYRKWSLVDLIEACSDALYEYEGRDVSVSKRTVQLDLQMMRSDKLGYNAPIEVYERKYYRYADPDFSITDVPLNESDMQILSESVEMLRQFKDFSLFADLGGIIQRLEDKVHTEKTQQSAIIHLDKNENLKGLEHLDSIYQAILKRIVLKMTYRSFTARQANSFIFHPYILKEFNNRWFVVGRRDQQSSIITLALDRIEKIGFDLATEYTNGGFDAQSYYKDTYGVTVKTDKELLDIILKVDRQNAPYVLTKPFHHSQEFIERNEDGSIIVQIKVHHNFEIERLLLGFGPSIEVISPNSLRRKFKWLLRKALVQYGSL